MKKDIYERPILKDMDLVGKGADGGSCTTGSMAGGACNDGGAAGGACLTGSAPLGAG